MSETQGHVCPECGAPRGVDNTPSCACTERASEALRDARTAEAAAAGDFNPLRIRPYVELDPSAGDGDGSPQGPEPEVPAAESTMPLRPIGPEAADADATSVLSTPLSPPQTPPSATDLRLFEAGLAYRAEAPVLWCPSCHTVLAREQVEDADDRAGAGTGGRELGRCERCSTPVVERRFTPAPPESVGVDPAALQVIRDGLYSATHSTYGTSSGVFSSFPVAVAGKTGTAEKVVPIPGYPADHLEDQSWWCGYGPAQTEVARVVVCAVIENGGHGSTAAAPAALRVFEKFFGVKAATQTLVETD